MIWWHRIRLHRIETRAKKWHGIFGGIECGETRLSKHCSCGQSWLLTFDPMTMREVWA